MVNRKNSEMVDINPNISVITVTVSELNLHVRK